MSEKNTLGILVVSHSADAASGIAHIAREVAGDGYAEIIGVGGNEEDTLGVSVMKVIDALSELLAKTNGILIVPDLGSSVLASRSAIEMFSAEDTAKMLIVDAPILEGTTLAAIEASSGSTLGKIAKVAMEARELKKFEH